eukprot:1235678-Rhodomonas_salina.2
MCIRDRLCDSEVIQHPEPLQAQRQIATDRRDQIVEEVPMQPDRRLFGQKRHDFGFNLVAAQPMLVPDITWEDSTGNGQHTG